ncbi:hypothetical protein TMatcc_007384 [Talaromyces marneffei ATCC 18224]
MRAYHGRYIVSFQQSRTRHSMPEAHWDTTSREWFTVQDDSRIYRSSRELGPLLSLPLFRPPSPAAFPSPEERREARPPFDAISRCHQNVLLVQF